MAENMDPFQVQKTSPQNSLFRTPIFINIFICTAKRPSSEHGKIKKPEMNFFPEDFVKWVV